MGLKKLFPVILVLISLSLIGLLVLQISWILTLLEHKQEELHHKMLNAVTQIRQPLILSPINSSDRRALKTLR